MENNFNLNTSLVRILKSNSESVGTGFMINSRQLFTCAHVVLDGMFTVKDRTGTHQHVYIDFPLAGNHSQATFKARMVQLYAPGGKAEIEDIALLEILPGSHPELCGVTLSETDEAMFYDLPVKMYGFPDMFDHGEWVDGTLKGGVSDGCVQITHDPGRRTVLPGFSGTAVWDKSDHTVTGMVVKIFRDEEDRVISYMIPASVLKKVLPEQPGKSDNTPFFGRIIPKMCDRDEQEAEFLKFFRERYLNCPNHPQLFIIHGQKSECHSSFVERLKNTRIRWFFEDKGKTVRPFSAEVHWRFTDNDSETTREILKQDIIEAFDPYYKGEFSLDALCHLPVLNQYHIVMISHDIFISDWNRKLERLVKWYINTYWASFECRDETDDTIPQFLIFLNIIYPDPDGMGWLQRLLRWNSFRKRRIRKFLKGIEGEATDPCQCLLVKELNPLTMQHVDNWFSWCRKHGVRLSHLKKAEKIREIFKGKKHASMASVEDQLEEIYREYDQAVAGLAKEQTGW
ncbi:MAG: trypsin-like peptidase domain-containing protein [Desulfobacteraceae bacterium]|nr:trypsin-like peptidase domain-containing protein [Desulfobacteraceae bacterium]